MTPTCGEPVVDTVKEPLHDAYIMQQDLDSIRSREVTRMGQGLRRIPQRALRDRVVDAIRDALIRGEFRPGEKVPEQQIAEQLGVSRTPVREALRILEFQGLLETRPKNGTYIARLRPEEARDGLLVRCALEELAVRQAVERLGSGWEKVCDGLQELLEGMREAIAGRDQVAATEFDIRWHAQLVDAAGNRQLSHAWRMVGSPLLVWSPEVEQYPLTIEAWVDVIDRHAQLLAVLRDADLAACADALREHIMRKLDDMNRPEPTEPTR